MATHDATSLQAARCRSWSSWFSSRTLRPALAAATGPLCSRQARTYGCDSSAWSTKARMAATPQAATHGRLSDVVHREQVGGQPIRHGRGVKRRTGLTGKARAFADRPHARWTRTHSFCAGSGSAALLRTAEPRVHGDRSPITP